MKLVSQAINCLTDKPAVECSGLVNIPPMIGENNPEVVGSPLENLPSEMMQTSKEDGAYAPFFFFATGGHRSVSLWITQLDAA
jgi:hypothetical protein